MNKYNVSFIRGCLFSRKLKSSSGFTLIELMAVVTILSILLLVGFTQFKLYRENAFDAQAQQDLKNSVTAQELYFIDNQSYVTCNTALDCENKLPSFKPTKNADDSPSMSIFENIAQTNTYTIRSKHNLSDNTFSFDSVTGVIQKNIPNS